MKTIFKSINLLLLSSLLWACVEPKANNQPQDNPAQNTTTQDSSITEKVTENTQPEQPAKPVIPQYDRKYNDAARILAGMPVDEASPYYAHTQSDQWKALAKQSDTNWERGEKERFGKMREWVTSELAEANKLSDDLFYPFSGPDAYHAYTLFPTASNYHLFALEPAGNLPLLDDVPTTKSIAYCQTVQQAIGDFFNSSFFYTKHMANQIPAASGAAPVICAFLVRAGNTIMKVEKIDINEDGSTKAITGNHSSIRIDFIDAHTGVPKSLFYHSSDVSNGGFKLRPSLWAYVQKYSHNRVFTKSASYLMHRSDFSQIREAIVKNASFVLQDDTGVPYKLFVDNGGWNTTFYGQYFAPIALFKERVQLDLRKAYEEGSPKELPFTIGYHSQKNKDNMIRFTKK